MDRERLVKVLGMMGSASDPEALSAARIATGLVWDAGLTWEAVVALDASPLDQRAFLLSVNRETNRRPAEDRAAFHQIRERYFAKGALDESDRRRLAYLHDLANPPPADDDIIPF